MFRQMTGAALAAALLASVPATGADLDVRPAPRESREGGFTPDAPRFSSGGGAVVFWRSYAWPGGQTGPCWRRWYGQWIWSC
ncbi:MAG: hypothetical protein ACR652_05070 [Methylocystis sp.]|uniref:hypothetical protein n=1 Tax=Methylocystis sp. TaxID=1911079 RepID=UPI003DA4CA8B